MDKLTSRVTQNPLAALAFNPPQVHFETQEDDEAVIVLLRRHFITNSNWILLGLLATLLPALFLFFEIGAISFSFSSLGFLKKIFLLWVWYLLVFGFLFENFLNWYFNVMIITNERIVDIDFRGLLYKNVTETQLQMVQDITHTVGGLAHILFDYGNLRIQTASETQDIEIRGIPTPAAVHKFLSELIEKRQEELK